MLNDLPDLSCGTAPVHLLEPFAHRCHATFVLTIDGRLEGRTRRKPEVECFECSSVERVYAACRTPLGCEFLQACFRKLHLQRPRFTIQFKGSRTKRAATAVCPL